MKKFSILFCVLLFAVENFGQGIDHDILGAKYLGSFFEQSEKDIESIKLSNGAEVLFRITNGDAIQLIIHSNDVHRNLCDFEYVDGWHEIAIFEYDFDKDKISEIIIIQGEYDGEVVVALSRDILSEVIGRFYYQGIVELINDRIILPFGGQGLANQYLYDKGDFYELIWHNPNSEE
jgi:hypothetical protein